MIVTEYTLKGCNFIRSDLLVSAKSSSSSSASTTSSSSSDSSSSDSSSSDSSSSSSLSISSPKDKYEIKKSRFNFISILKNDTLFYLVKNISITEELESGDVIVDPAGLDYILYNSMDGAGGGSGEIYELLENKKFDKNVKKFFESKGLKYFRSSSDNKKENEKLYLNDNKINTDITPSKVGLYKLKDTGHKINIIHTVGPKFSGNDALKNILEKDESKLNEIYYKIYESIFKEFISIKNHETLFLRLLPVSIGLYLPSINRDINRVKILKSIKRALFILLNKPQYQHLIEKVELYLFEKTEYNEYQNLFK